MNIVVRKLIAKELYVNRWFILGATLSGVLSALVAGSGSKTGFNIGMLTWITTIIAFGVMLGIYGVANERKEHSLLFVLSLPISAGDYVRAKQIGLALCFFAPWLISSAAALALILIRQDIPDGLVPFTILLCVFMLTNFALVLCGALHARSEAAMTSVIIVTNMAVSAFMFTVAAIPAIGASMFGPVPIWNTTTWTVLALELVVLVCAFLLPYLFAARRRDFI
jgi:ABC-type transport system involved in multi-copper enzyme maturation permease subunit